jgi:hypothetical protein
MVARGLAWQAAVVALLSSLLALFGCDAGRIAKLEEGVSTEAEVRARVGRPARMHRYELRNEEVWDWRFRSARQTSKLSSVSFDAGGRVMATSVSEDPRDTAGGPSN